MATDIDMDLLTTAEAAKLLKISVVTLQRWLKQGRLRAFRLGPRAVRIRRSDLDELLLPLTPEAGHILFETEKVYKSLDEIPRLTEDEKRKQLEAIEAARAFREEVAARRGGKPFSPSWPLIRKAREERSRQL